MTGYGDGRGRECYICHMAKCNGHLRHISLLRSVFYTPTLSVLCALLNCFRFLGTLETPAIDNHQPSWIKDAPNKSNAAASAVDDSSDDGGGSGDESDGDPDADPATDAAADDPDADDAEVIIIQDARDDDDYDDVHPTNAADADADAAAAAAPADHVPVSAALKQLKKLSDYQRKAYKKKKKKDDPFYHEFTVDKKTNTLYVKYDEKAESEAIYANNAMDYLYKITNQDHCNNLSKEMSHVLKTYPIDAFVIHKVLVLPSTYFHKDLPDPCRTALERLIKVNRVPVKFANDLPHVKETQQHVNEYINELTVRISNNKGRVDSLTSKPVNNVVRLVITPASYLDVDEVGIPREVADKLMVLQDLPRKIQDGDIAVFTRQPALHRYSMLAMRVRILPYGSGMTLRMNPTIAAPFNADFDGDQMNLHIVQSNAAINEVHAKMMPSNNVMTGQDARPLVGVMQDGVMGLWLLTHPSMPPVPARIAMQLVARLDGVPLIDFEPGINSINGINGINGIRGIDLVDRILQKLLPVYKYGSVVYESTDGKVTRDQHGVLRADKRALAKKDVGPVKESLIQAIAMRAGYPAAVRVIQNLQLLGTSYLDIHGHSIDRSDIARAMDDYERNDAFSNPLVAMVESGAKGKKANLQQMARMLGQQTLFGKTLEDAYSCDRLSSHFALDNMCNSVVQSCFLAGLSPIETFLHLTASLESLFQNTTSTTNAGMISKHLASGLIDVIVSTSSICTKEGRIISFDVGSDPEKHSRIYRRDDAATYVDMVYDEKAAATLGALGETWRFPVQPLPGSGYRIPTGVHQGIITTHAFGEQTLQLTLNTHQNAGQADGTVVDRTDHVYKVMHAHSPLQPQFEFEASGNVDVLGTLQRAILPVHLFDVFSMQNITVHDGNEVSMTISLDRDDDELVALVLAMIGNLPPAKCISVGAVTRHSMTIEATKLDKLTEFRKSAIIRGIRYVTRVYQPDPEKRPSRFVALYKRNIKLPDSMRIARMIAALSIVKTNSVIPNDAKVAEALYGIEAAARVIVRELASSYDSILQFHMRLIADCMTHHGALKSISSMELIPRRSNTMHYASVRSTFHTFLTAALEKYKDSNVNTNSRIMMGIPLDISQEEIDDFMMKRCILDEERKQELRNHLATLGL